MAPARELYTGRLFKLVLQYATENHLDLRILSAKHGLVTPDVLIEPYDLRITGRAQIDSLQKTVLPDAAYFWCNYARIIIIMGSQYIKVLNPILKRQGKWKLDAKVIVDIIRDERGIGGLLQKVKMMIDAARVERAKHREPYTRETAPTFCKKCSHHACTFDASRKAALPNGNDNPACMPCDYCCKWENEAYPDKFQPNKKVKKMAEPVKPNPEQKEESKEQKEAICGGCHEPIKAGATNIVQDPRTGERFHTEHYGMDERHETPSEDKYECIACSVEFPEDEMHTDKDGEKWCKKCWAAEHPRKKRSSDKPRTCADCGKVTASLGYDSSQDKWLCKKCSTQSPARKPGDRSKPPRNLPLAYQQKIYRETADYPYEKWPVEDKDEIDLRGAFGVRNLVREEGWSNAKMIEELRKWDQEHSLEKKSPKTQPTFTDPNLAQVVVAMEKWAKVNMASMDRPYEKMSIDDLRSLAILRHEHYPATLKGDQLRQDLISRLSVGDSRRQILVERFNAAALQGILICPICQEKLLPENPELDPMSGLMVHHHCQVKFEAEVNGAEKTEDTPKETVEEKLAITSGPVDICPRCQLPKVKGNYEGIKKCNCDMPGTWAKGVINTGKRLYEIFVAHARQIAPLLSPEEQAEMNEIGDVLENA